VRLSAPTVAPPESRRPPTREAGQLRLPSFEELPSDQAPYRAREFAGSIVERLPDAAEFDRAELLGVDCSEVPCVVALEVFFADPRGPNPKAWRMVDMLIQSHFDPEFSWENPDERVGTWMQSPDEIGSSIRVAYWRFPEAAVDNPHLRAVLTESCYRRAREAGFYTPTQ